MCRIFLKDFFRCASMPIHFKHFLLIFGKRLMVVFLDCKEYRKSNFSKLQSNYTKENRFKFPFNVYMNRNKYNTVQYNWTLNRIILVCIKNETKLD